MRDGECPTFIYFSIQPLHSSCVLWPGMLRMGQLWAVWYALLETILDLQRTIHWKEQQSI